MGCQVFSLLWLTHRRLTLPTCIVNPIGYDEVVRIFAILLIATINLANIGVAQAKSPAERGSAVAVALARAADDPAALDLLAADLVPADVGRALRRKDPTTVRAAIALASDVRGAIALLPDLMRIAQRPAGAPLAKLSDDALAAVHRIVRDTLGPAGDREPLTGDDRDDFIVAVVALVQRTDLPSARRVAALEVASDLLRAPAEDSDQTLLRTVLMNLLSDRDAELRLAAAELVPDPADGGGALAQRLLTTLSDPDERVALAAAAQLCPSSGSGAALPEPAIVRVRAALLDPARLVSQMLALMPCLRAHGAADDAAALKALRKHRSPAVKKLAAALAFKPAKN
jgi:hypothetical protein